MKDHANALIVSAIRHIQSLLNESKSLSNKDQKLQLYRPLYEINRTLHHAPQCRGTDSERIAIAKSLTSAIDALREAIDSIEIQNLRGKLWEQFQALESAILEIVRLVGASAKDAKSGSFTRQDGSLRIISRAELARHFNGGGKNRACIAVAGLVYDVTDLPQWRGGIHHGFFAGRDYTTEFAQAHQADMKFLRKYAPVIAILSDD